MYLTANRKAAIILIALLLAMIIGIIIPSITNGQEPTSPDVEVVSFTANGRTEGGIELGVTFTDNVGITAASAKIYRHTIGSIQSGGLGQEIATIPNATGRITFVDSEAEHGVTYIYELVLYDDTLGARSFGMPTAVGGIPHLTQIAGGDVNVTHFAFQSVRLMWDSAGSLAYRYQVCGATRLANGHWSSFVRCTPQVPGAPFNMLDLQGLDPGRWLFVLVTRDATGNTTWLWAGPPGGLELNDWAVHFPVVKIGKEPAPTPIPDTPD